MVVYSQNGYIANDRSLIQTFTVPGSKVRLAIRKGACADVLLYVASRFDDEVEDIDTAHAYDEDAAPSIAGGGPSAVADDWSYAERNVRGSMTTVSNHASGTAIDLNATQHVRGVRGTYTAAQVAAVRRILASLVDPVTGRCVVRWGEDYRAPSIVDGMHFEINAAPDAVQRVADRIAKSDKQGDDDMTPEQYAEVGPKVMQDFFSKWQVQTARGPRTLLQMISAADATSGQVVALQAQVDALKAAVGALPAPGNGAVSMAQITAAAEAAASKVVSEARITLGDG